LFGRADVAVAGREAVVCVVVQGIDAIREDVVEGAEIGGEGIAIEPEDVVWVDFADCGFDTVIVGD
jgi:hypothetical protein